MDIFQTVLGVIQSVEVIVKCIRLLESYNAIDKHYVDDLGYVLQIAEHLSHLESVPGNVNPGDRANMARSYDSAVSAVKEVKAELLIWAKRTGIELGDEDGAERFKEIVEDSDVETLSSANLTPVKVEKDPVGDNSSVAPHENSGCWRITRRILDLSRLRRRFLMKSKPLTPPEAELVEQQPQLLSQRGHAVSNVTGRIAFLVHYPDLRDTIDRMSRSYTTLTQLISISQLPAHIRYSDGSALFIKKARARDDPKNGFIPKAIAPIPDEFMQPIDPDVATSLYLVTEGDYKGCIVDRRAVLDYFLEGRIDTATDDTKRIARLLGVEPRAEDGSSNMTIGILRCCGYTLYSTDTNDLVLTLPLKAFHSRPRTLRRLLSTPGTGQHNLDARLGFALTLATSVHILHSVDIVHKFIRPETTLVLDPEDGSGEAGAESSNKLGTPFLAGYINARSNSSFTAMNTFDDHGITQKLYLHPRQLIRAPGGGRLIAYQMEDDIYSLGICLLEIGLWKSLFAWNEERKLFMLDPTVCDLSDYCKHYKTKNGGIRDDVWSLRRKDLIKFAEEQVGKVMGGMYRDVVVACLEFSERQEAERASAGANSHSPFVFLRDVLSKLRQIRM